VIKTFQHFVAMASALALLVGRLWGIIVIESFLAFFAELFDLLIDHHVL